MQVPKTILAALFAILAAPALAQSALPTEEATVTDTRLTCVHQDAPTGSRIGGKKVCHTEAQWREIRAQAALDMSNLQTRSDNGFQGAANAAGQ